jgi:NADH-quinone oxidoreductase subunit N
VILAAAKAPHVDFAGLSPLLALLVGAVVVLMVGLASGEAIRRRGVPALTLVALGAALGLSWWQLPEHKSIVAGALAVDELAMVLNILFIVAGIAAVLLALRDEGPSDVGAGEVHALLLSAIAGMSVLAGARNTVALFLGFELLSIPLYVLCATHLRRRESLGRASSI